MWRVVADSAEAAWPWRQDRQLAALVSISYTYDLADRLTAITSASGSTTSFTIDALGRHASQTIGSTTSSYAYLGSSDVVVAVTSASSTTTSAVDGLGDRVASAAGGTFGFLVSDLHGNVAGALDASASSFTDAFAYDAYGDTVASLTSSLPTPWRYQGRMLESGAGAPALYDFAARSYAPSLGIFTSLDTLGGSATNPALLNGYLYADANPATLVDPDGHSARIMYDEGGTRGTLRAAPRGAVAASWADASRHDMSTSVYNEQHLADSWAAASATDMGSSVNASQEAAWASANGGDGTVPATTPSGPAMSAAPDRRAQAYDFCMANYADNPSGTMPDTSQQAMTCHAQVARQFNQAAPEDFGTELQTASLALCLVYCTAFVAVAGAEALAAAPGAAAAAGGLAAECEEDPEECTGRADTGAAAEDAAGGCSFTPDTQVATAAGSTAIASLRVGDTVQAYDPKTGETGPHTVSAVMAHTDPSVEHLKLDTGSIDTTPNHPFFTIDRGWVDAGSLVAREEVKTESGGYATVLGFTVSATPSTMWDLTVEGAHSFFVGQGAVLVHNCGPDGEDGNGLWQPPSGARTTTGGIRALAQQMGLDPNAVMQYIEEEVKPDAYLGAPDNVSVGPDGTIYSPAGENLGNIDEAPPARR